MNTLIQALQDVAPIKNYRYWPASHHSADGRSTPPVAWLMFERPTRELAEFLENAVITYKGAESWHVYIAPAVMWILMPKRIREYKERHQCFSDLHAAAEMKVNEPDFGERANEDVRLLADHIRRCLISSQVALPHL